LAGEGALDLAAGKGIDVVWVALSDPPLGLAHRGVFVAVRHRDRKRRHGQHRTERQAQRACERLGILVELVQGRPRRHDVGQIRPGQDQPCAPAGHRRQQDVSVGDRG